MQKIKVSDYIVKYFEEKKIGHVFTVSGGGSIFLCDSLATSRKIKYIACHHEQAVSFAAESYSRFLNSPSLAMVTTGPGGTNAITGVTSSWIDSVPVIFISGQVYLNQTIGKSKIRQKGVQETNIIELIKPITKYSVMIKNKNEIKYHLDRAYYETTNSRPGPVWIDVPANIQNSWIDLNELDQFKPRKVSTKNRSYKKEEIVINRISKKLLKSKKPILFIGRGAAISKSERICLKILKEFKIPFALSWNASDLVPNNMKNYIGKPGSFTERAANFAIQSCDLFLSVGSRLNYTVTGYNAKDFARKAFKIMVDIDGNELKDSKNRINTNLTLKISANKFFEILYKFLKKNKSKNDCDYNNWMKYINHTKKKYPILLDAFINQKKFLNSYYFIDQLSNFSQRREVIVTDMGLSFVGTHQMFKINSINQKVFTNSGHAPMGWGLPAAIGACFANRKRRVICITGDGGLQMNVQELATIKHHNLPIIIFLYNNLGYSTIKQTQELGFHGRKMGCDESSGLSFPSYKNLSKAYGLSYVCIKNNKDLDIKLKKIMKIEKPLFCELLLDPDQPQIPKLINRRTKDNKIPIPSGYEDLYPFLPIEEVEKNIYEK